jgi:hypothetical protein
MSLDELDNNYDVWLKSGAWAPPRFWEWRLIPKDAPAPTDKGFKWGSVKQLAGKYDETAERLEKLIIKI